MYPCNINTATNDISGGKSEIDKVIELPRDDVSTVV